MSAESPARDVARAVADPAERSVEDVVLERIAERDARSARGSTALARDLFREQDELLARLADVETRRAEAERRARESEARAVSLEEELALTRERGEGASSSGGKVDEKERATRLEAEVAAAYKKRSESNQKTMETREALEKEEMARAQVERELDALRGDMERVQRRVQDAEKAAANARKAESQALDEAESQTALKNAVIGRVDKLESDNEDLLKRLMEFKMKEAEKMNELNDLYDDLMRQKKSAELTAKADSLAEASATSMKALSMSMVMNNAIPSKKRHILQGNKGGTHRVALSHDGFTVACAGEDNLVAMFDTNTGIRTGDLSGMLGAVLDVSFSADDSLVLGASTDCALQLWDVATGRVKHRLTGHAQKVTSARISHIDGKRAISCSQDRNIKVWDLNRGHATGSMLTPSNVYSVCYDATEQQAISSHFDGAVRIWDIRTNRMDRENIVHASPVTSIVFMPNQNEILTNSRDNTLKLIDLRTMDVVKSFSAPKYRVGTDWSNPCVAPDGAHIASGGADGGVFIWRVKDGRLMMTLHGHDAAVATCAWSASGALASACKNGVCLLWE